MKTSLRKKSLSPPISKSRKRTAAAPQTVQPNLLTDIVTREVVKTFKKYKNRTLLYHFQKDNIKTFTGKEALTIIKKSACALKSLGVKQKQHIGIMSKSSPYWVCFEQAILSIGAVSIGFFEKISFENLKAQLAETQTEFIFVDNEEAAEKLTAFQKNLKTIILEDSLYKKVKANKNFIIPRILSWSQFLNLSKTSKQRTTYDLEKDLLALKKQQVAATIYTTGTSNQAKGVILTHEHFMFQITALKNLFHIKPLTDRAVSLLPLSHILERIAVYVYMITGMPICFIEENQKFQEAITQFKPTCITVVPQILERIHKNILENAPKLFLVNQLYKNAIKHAETREIGASPTWKDWLFKSLFYRAFYQALGGNLRFIPCSGALLKPQLTRFFHSIGIPVYEGFGLTETCSTISCNNETHFKPYSVGKIIPGVTVKISNQGELIVHSPSLMKGYLKNPKLTKAKLKKDPQGNLWFATGDKAQIKDGYIFLEGRIKNFFKVSSGYFVNPSQIENSLEQHHFIKNAVILGELRPAICSLIFIDTFYVPRQDKEFKKMVEKQVHAWVEVINSKLTSWETVKKSKIIWEPLSYENEELTLKQEPRRDIIIKKFKREIEEMYEAL